MTAGFWTRLEIFSTLATMHSSTKRLGWFVVLLSALAVPLLAPNARAADRIVLRNLKIIGDREIKAWDEGGVRLDDERLITWDEIERATLAPERQVEFDKLLKELGEPLYRIRQRLKVGDYAGLHTPAEAVWPRYSGRRGESAYLVTQAVMWSRLARGEREAAVAPYLQCFALLRGKAKDEVQLPGTRRLTFDPQTGLTSELAPIWFDSAAAKQALPEVLRATGALAEPRPEGARVYYGTLALATGETEAGLKVLNGVSNKSRAVAELRDIALAQHEIQSGQPGPALAKLERQAESLLPANQPLAIYWLAYAKLTSTNERLQREGILQALHLPALYGSSHAELAGAGLYQARAAFDKLNDARSSAAVRKELLLKFPQTFHAAKVRAEPDDASAPK